jgi:magnesium chelatase family protein
LRQAGEAKLVAGIDVFGIASITQLVVFLRDEPRPLVDPIEVLGDPASKHASIVGGGQRMARPGAISCAHKGVLFPDDSTEAQSIRLGEFIPSWPATARSRGGPLVGSALSIRTIRPRYIAT